MQGLQKEISSKTEELKMFKLLEAQEKCRQQPNSPSQEGTKVASDSRFEKSIDDR